MGTELDCTIRTREGNTFRIKAGLSTEVGALHPCTLEVDGKPYKVWHREAQRLGRLLILAHDLIEEG